MAGKSEISNWGVHNAKRCLFTWQSLWPSANLAKKNFSIQHILFHTESLPLYYVYNVMDCVPGCVLVSWCLLSSSSSCPCGETQTMFQTMSNPPVPWQNWTAVYLGYTLWMKTLFRGRPVMTRIQEEKRRSSSSIIITSDVKPELSVDDLCKHSHEQSLYGTQDSLTEQYHSPDVPWHKIQLLY